MPTTIGIHPQRLPFQREGVRRLPGATRVRIACLPTRRASVSTWLRIPSRRPASVTLLRSPKLATSTACTRKWSWCTRVSSHGGAGRRSRGTRRSSRHPPRTSRCRRSCLARCPACRSCQRRWRRGWAGDGRSCRCAVARVAPGSGIGESMLHGLQERTRQAPVRISARFAPGALCERASLAPTGASYASPLPSSLRDDKQKAARGAAKSSPPFPDTARSGRGEARVAGSGSNLLDTAGL